MTTDLAGGPLAIKPGEPWVLLDDARAGGGGLLHRSPVRCLRADRAEEVGPLLDGLDWATADGLTAVGWLAYEAGDALSASRRDPAPAPLGWFGLFERGEAVPDVARHLPPAGAGAVAGVEPGWSREEYATAFGRVADAIRAGTAYQVNLTFPSRVTIAGDPLAVYARLRRAAAAPFSAVVWTGERLVLSFSPELFVRRDGDRLSARPMKGTAPRGADPVADRAAAAALSADPKQRAENRMIVDLIRNDLARVSRPGTVRVSEDFATEAYPTVHQMTSTVTAEAVPGLTHADALRALFPCGSITGAPKLAARQLIGELEAGPRGVYCGAVGRMGPGDRLDLAVAIRTLEIAELAPPGGITSARLGLGSGVVADSTAADEWGECRLKGAFVDSARPAFDLIETMCFDPNGGLARLDGHLARLGSSAAALGFAFDRHGVRNELQAATFGLGAPTRVRLLLGVSGAVAVGLDPLPQATPLTAVLRPIGPGERDLRRWHKTTDRAFYDAPRRDSGADEVVFTDGDRLLEGSFTTVFVERDGVLLTPPADRALIPGVLRAELLASGRAVEAPLTPADLANGFQLGNSARGLMSARLRT